jgi:hypothetical protein
MSSPKECRQHLHTLVAAALDGNGILAADIHRYRTANFSNNPTHCVISTDGFMADFETANDVGPGYIFFVQLLARYNDEASKEAAEDALDDLDYLLIPALSDAQGTDYWDTLDFIGQTRRGSVRYGSHNYRVSQIKIKLEI